MKIRRRYWLFLLAFIGVSLAVYFEPGHRMRGWLWGEAFFEGRPTSYWRGVVARDLQVDLEVFLGRLPPRPSWWGRCKDWIGYQPHVDSSLALLDSDTAHAVLLQLQEDDNEKIAGFAKDALDLDRRREGLRRFSDDPAEFYWIRLVSKHHVHNRKTVGFKWEE